MRFNIITIFPKIFDSYLNEGMLKRALDKKIIFVKAHDLRRQTKDKHKTVDDSPYGGGAGMVLMAAPIIKTIRQIKMRTRSKKCRVVLLSAKGKTWNQTLAKKYACLDQVIFICGRYEGVDERVKKFVDEEISVGNYVLTGGELAALNIIDSVARLLPGVLGNKESAVFESHAQTGVLEHPHYTRPEMLEIDGKKYRVPKVLLSGNHQKITEWREKKSKKIS